MNAENRIERLDTFMRYKGMNDNQMTVQCGLSVGLIGKARKHKSTLGEGTILKVSRTFPEVNVDWLLNGNGSMLKDTTTNGTITSEPVARYGSGTQCHSDISRLVSEIAAQRKVTETAQSHLTEAQRQLTEAHGQVNRLIAIVERLTNHPE